MDALGARGFLAPPHCCSSCQSGSVTGDNFVRGWEGVTLGGVAYLALNLLIAAIPIDGRPLLLALGRSVIMVAQ
jgi:hypothetical protein